LSREVKEHPQPNNGDSDKTARAFFMSKQKTGKIAGKIKKQLKIPEVFGCLFVPR
jgi:hypothetical protein